MPAIVDYIPYRKRDLTRERDELNHPYIAGHGYVCARVDMRGSGDSDGVLRGGYCPQEHRDAENVIAWLAEQRRCDGHVGMMGISWGGFNSLQVAARRPPALRAIVSASATEDLYVDNMHYVGGALLADKLSEATVMLAFDSLPPDPEIVGDQWREMWHDRLQGSGLWIDKWLRHQRRDEYWSFASVSEGYSAIDCPVLAVGGWADGYTNAIFRLMERLDVPRKALIGPWGHKYPHLGQPGPPIGFLQELVPWWDYWLKGIDNGSMSEPMLRVWMQDAVPPQASYRERPGRWVAENSWPSARILDSTWVIAPHHLHPSGSPAANDAERERVDLPVNSPLSVGMFAGKWASYAATPDLPFDQREEDGGALVFESAPLADDLEILGLPTLDAVVTADQPVAQLVAHLSDVHPDGEATRITYGVLNLTHRESDADPTPLVPGDGYRVSVQLNGIAQKFPAGHRIRLSLSTSYWPLVWPSPHSASVTLTTGHTLLSLPVREPNTLDRRLRPLGPPEAAPELDIRQIKARHHLWKVTRDLASDVSALEIKNDDGHYLIEDTGAQIRSSTDETFSFRWNDVGSVRGETRSYRSLERGEWRTDIETQTTLTSSAHAFSIAADLDAYEKDMHSGDDPGALAELERKNTSRPAVMWGHRGRSSGSRPASKLLAYRDCASANAVGVTMATNLQSPSNGSQSGPRPATCPATTQARRFSFLSPRCLY